MIRRFTPVVVTWHDAHGGSDITAVFTADDIEGLHKPITVQTYGVLLKMDETGVTLACEHFPETNEIRGRTFVGTGMLVSVEPLRRASVKPKKKASKDQDASDESKPLE